MADTRPDRTSTSQGIDDKVEALRQIEEAEIGGARLAEPETLEPAEQKRILRKIDVRLLPILGLMYSMSLIDRGNLGLALVAGMQLDLGLHIGSRYTIDVMIFFIAYILFEIPSNLVLPKIGPARWLTFLGISFGVCMLGMGFVNTWWQLAICRALLGTFEAGFLPGCAYLITCWYTRFEVGKRLSGFWILSVIASGFSSILAYVFSLLKGKGNLNGWRWIFIIEGIITICVCCAGIFLIIDFPAKATKFLQPHERKFVIRRINNDRGDAEEDKVTGAKILHHLKDVRLYAWAFNLMSAAMPAYAYAFFLPLILNQGMGFSVTESQLLGAPPHVLAAVLTFTSGWLGDKYKIRGPIICVHLLMTAVGMIIMTYGGSPGFRLFGSFVLIGFVHFCVPGTLVFQANNITSHSKRAVSSATGLIGGGVGGVIAGVAFKADEAPNYVTGVWVTLAICLTSILIIVITDIYHWRQNKLAKEGKIVIEGIPGFLYTL